MRRIKMFLISLSFLAYAANSYGISEQNYHETMITQVLPDIRNHAVHSTMNFQGVDLSYLFYKPAGERGPVVISPGRTESFVDYYEFVFDLAKLGFAPSFVLDHRGQGFSSRLLPDRQKGHVNRIYDYDYDLRHFINHVVRAHTSAKITLIGHSMGSLINNLYMIQAPEAAEVVARAIHIAPMFGVDLGKYGNTVSKYYLRVLCWLRRCEQYAPGEGPHTFTPFSADNRYTSSRARYEFSQSQLKRVPEIAIGGPTNRWVLESLTGIRRVRRYSHYISIPTTMIYSSMDERVVGSEAAKVCDIMANCQAVDIPQGRHQLHFERDDIRNAVFQYILWSGRL